MKKSKLTKEVEKIISGIGMSYVTKERFSGDDEVIEMNPIPSVLIRIVVGYGDYELNYLYIRIGRFGSDFKNIVENSTGLGWNTPIGLNFIATVLVNWKVFIKDN